MKKSYILFVPFLLILVVNSHAIAQRGPIFSASGPYSDKPVDDELKKGNWNMGLNGFGKWGNSYIRKFGSWSLTPQTGYFVVDRLVAGVQLSIGENFSRPKQQRAAPTATDYKLYALNPEIFGRYYATPYRVKPFVQIATGYNFQWGKRLNTNNERIAVNANNITVSGAVGLNFMLSKSVAVEALYNHRFAANSTLTDPNKDIKIRVGASVFLR